MTAPIQMTKNTLNALKGWPQQSAVDFTAEFDPSITDRVPPGTCVHLTSDLQYALGVGNEKVMPLFTFMASDDPDVKNDGGDPATEKGVWVGTSPSGQCMALVAVGAYELVSTQFVSGTYNPNDPLTSATGGANAGKLAVGTLYTNMIVGIVSRGIVDNGHGEEAVAFWPIPVFPTA